MKLKILKFFTLMFGMQFVVCPLGPDIRIQPNTPICTLTEALANDIDAEQQTVYQEVLKHFTKGNGQDFLNIQLLADKSSAKLQLKQIGELATDIMSKIQSFLITSESFQLPLDVYSALFPKFDLIQGKDGKIYLPYVMQDGKVQMRDSGMRFMSTSVKCNLSDVQNSHPKDENQLITGSIRSSDNRLLAEIQVVINQKGNLQCKPRLIWKRDYCTQECINKIQSRHPGLIAWNKLKIDDAIISRTFCNRNFRDSLRIEANELDILFDLSWLKFPMQHILADSLVRFDRVVESALPNPDGQSFGVIDKQSQVEKLRFDKNQLFNDKNRPYIRYTALIDTLDISSPDQS